MNHNYIPLMYTGSPNYYGQNEIQSDIKNYNVPSVQNKFVDHMYRTFPNEVQEFHESHSGKYQFLTQQNEYDHYIHNSNDNLINESIKPFVPTKEHSGILDNENILKLSNNENLNEPPIVNDKLIEEKTIQDDSEHKIILEIGPGSHQIKEYNIRPVNVVKVNYTPSNSDILVVKLMCDPAMKLNDCEFFLTALSPKYQTDDSDRLYLPNLKISKDMLKGRTKGYKFKLVYSLFIKGEETYRVLSEPFDLWSNVNQAGFPREERDSYVNTEKKRKRQSSK